MTKLTCISFNKRTRTKRWYPNDCC